MYSMCWISFSCATPVPNPPLQSRDSFHARSCGLSYVCDLDQSLYVFSGSDTMKLLAFGAAVVLLLACSFGSHARVAPHRDVTLLYKTGEQKSVGDIWSNCGEIIYTGIQKHIYTDNHEHPVLALPLEINTMLTSFSMVDLLYLPRS